MGAPSEGSPTFGRTGGLCLGTDSNARISMVEEMRWLEYGQRLREELRGRITDDRGDSATALVTIATRGGARSLGIEAGEIEAGRWADLTALDLDAPGLAGADTESLLPAWIFGGGNEIVAGTFVAGRWRGRGRAEA